MVEQPVPLGAGGGLARRGSIPELPTDTARVELARAWLGSFAPATAADLKWWTGWTMGAVKAALAALPVVEVDVEDSPRPGLLLSETTAAIEAEADRLGSGSGPSG